MLIELNIKFLKSTTFKLIIQNRIEQIFKRSKTIRETKTYKEKIISNLRDDDYKSYEMEMNALYFELENLKQLTTDINNFNC